MGKLPLDILLGVYQVSTRKFDVSEADKTLHADYQQNYLLSLLRVTWRVFSSINLWHCLKTTVMFLTAERPVSKQMYHGQWFWIHCFSFHCLSFAQSHFLALSLSHKNARTRAHNTYMCVNDNLDNDDYFTVLLSFHTLPTYLFVLIGAYIWKTSLPEGHFTWSFGMICSV